MMKFSRTICTVRNFCVAMLVATGAFWAVTLLNPPKTEAAVPQMTQFSPMSMPVPANLPIGVYDAV